MCIRDRSDAFPAHALGSKRPWQSDGAAAIYCPARTLPVVLRFTDQISHLPRAKDFISRIWDTVTDNPMCHGIRELGTKPPRGYPWTRRQAGRPRLAVAPPILVGDLYPANTFHTYWALRCVEEYRATCARLGAASSHSLPGDIARKIRWAWAWSRATLSLQIALHESGSQAFDRCV